MNTFHLLRIFISFVELSDIFYSDTDFKQKEKIMYKKLKHVKKILLATVVSTPLFAASQDVPFKMVVMSDDGNGQSVMHSNPNVSINKLKRLPNTKYSYNANMGLCVAYMKKQSLNKSVRACSAAINSRELAKLDKDTSNYYKALGYSNRGVSKYKSGDITGAYADLSLASKTNTNPIVQANFLLIQEVVEASL